MPDVDLSQWIGRSETLYGILGPDVAAMLEATVGSQNGHADQKRGEMPFLAHWCMFTPQVPMERLSADGHPKLGGFLPPVSLERRMWAGGSLEFHAPLLLGEEIERHSTIASISEKEGAAGPMVFVQVRHELSQNGILAVTEFQDIVYLKIPDEFTPPALKPVIEAPDFSHTVEVTEATLFRFSAATFNAHRIHYDLDYAKNIEKYPGLVVHGPLQAMYLMRAAIAHSSRRPRSFSFRGIHPMFHFDDLHLYGKDTDDGMILCTGIPDGHQGMQAKITWEVGQ